MGNGQSNVFGINLESCCSDGSRGQEETTQKEWDNLNILSRKIQIKGCIQDIVERKKYATRIFSFVVCWSAVTVFILLLQGFGVKYGFFNLSDKVLICLISATTVNVLGVFVIVAKYLFQ